MPTQFPNLRTVPAYNHFLKERFERCLDLYLAPRQRKMKMNVNKECFSIEEIISIIALLGLATNFIAIGKIL